MLASNIYPDLKIAMQKREFKVCFLSRSSNITFLTLHDLNTENQIKFVEPREVIGGLGDP